MEGKSFENFCLYFLRSSAQRERSDLNDIPVFEGHLLKMYLLFCDFVTKTCFMVKVNAIAINKHKEVLGAAKVIAVD